MNRIGRFIWKLGRELLIGLGMTIMLPIWVPLLVIAMLGIGLIELWEETK